MNILEKAIHDNNLHQLKLLLDLGYNINEINDYGETMLHIAIKEACSIEIIELLYSFGANLYHKRNIDNYTPLHLLIMKGYKSFIKELIERGKIRRSHIEQHRLLFIAAECNQQEIYDSLLLPSVEIEPVNSKGETPLFDAVKSLEASELVRYFLNKGFNMHHKNRDFKSAFFDAVSYGCLDIVNIFIENGANVNERDKDQNTPLFNVNRENKKEALKITKVLLDNGANVNALNRYRQTPIFNAIMHYDFHIEIVELFIEYGANLNAICANNETPKMLMQRSNNNELNELIKRYR